VLGGTGVCSICFFLTLVEFLQLAND